jgi:lipopolysaccharide/colanic/teichoic acid biosynthesis glycosyltransferase
MKFSGVTYLILTSILLVIVAVLAYLNAGFPVVFYLTLAGQFLLIFSVYKILTDNNYKTKKTFDDWYEDYPHNKEEN